MMKPGATHSDNSEVVFEKTLEGHKKSIQALASCHDGRLASGSADFTIKIWNIATDKCEKVLKGHDGPVTSLISCLDGQLASGAYDKTVKVWDVKSGKSQTLKGDKKDKGYGQVVHSLAVFSDGMLASGNDTGYIKLWDVKTGKCEQTFDQGVSAICSLMPLENGLLAAGTDYNKEIQFWDKKSGRCVKTLSAHNNKVAALIQLPDGRLVSGSGGGLENDIIKFWDLKTWRCLKTIEKVLDQVYAFAVCPNGQLASGHKPGIDGVTLNFWDVNSFKAVQSFSLHKDEICALTLTKDGRLASGSEDNTIKIWRLPKAKQQPIIDLSMHSIKPPSLFPKIQPGSIKPPEFVLDSTPNSNPGTSAPMSSSIARESAELRKEAEKYYGQGQYAEALNWYRKLAMKGDESAQKMVVSIEKMLNEVAAMSANSEKLSSNAEGSSDYKKGKQYFQNKQYDKAKKYFQRAANAKYPGADAKLNEVDQAMATSQPVAISKQTHQSLLQPITRPAIPTKPVKAQHGLLDVPYQALQLEKELGKGGFGVVYIGKWDYNTVAIKKLLAHSLTQEALNEFTHEADLMSRLRHPNIVTFYKICKEPGNYCIVMEYCEKGSLYQWLRTKEAESWSERQRISLEVVKGLAYLHDNKILHRDLKSPNVLLDKTLTAKISDFGLSTVKTETASQTAGGVKGTLRWNPPELVTGEEEHHSEKTDIYSLGMTLWEIASRKTPFAAQANEMLVMGWIMQGKQETIPADAPPKLAHLIGQCWDKRSEQRPTARAAVDSLANAERSIRLPAQSYRLTS